MLASCVQNFMSFSLPKEGGNIFFKGGDFRFRYARHGTPCICIIDSVQVFTLFLPFSCSCEVELTKQMGWNNVGMVLSRQ